MFEFSARNVGPNVYTLPSEQAKISASSCPLTVKYVGRPKKSPEKSGPSRGSLAEIERGDLEHLPRPFAVARRDDGRMNVEKALLLKEVVDRAANAIADPCYRSKRVGARPEVGQRSQEFEGMSLLLQRIGLRIGPAVDNDLSRVHFGFLSLRRRLPNFARDGNAATGSQMLDLRLVVGQGRLGDDLNVAEARAIVQLEKAEAALGVAAGPHPAVQLNLSADALGPPRLGDRYTFHLCSFS